MKKKILSILLVLCISLVPTLLVACEGDEEQGGGGGGTTGIGSLPAADVEVTVEHVPSVMYDTSDYQATDASIKTDTLLVSYDIDETLTLYLDKATNVTVSDGETYTANGKRYNEYTVTATGAGDYNVYFVTADEELAASYTYTVSEAYPARTRFPAMTGLGQSNNSSTGIANAHDPSIIEVTEDGQSVYYTFGTDNYSQYGYAIRRSTDLINWSYVGVAIPGFNESGAAPSDSNPITESNELYDIYEIVSSDANWAANTADPRDENNWTLWAPNVVEAYGGGYWLYGCWTVNFGQGHSIIFQCYSESITGPYELVYTENNNPAIILYSYDGWEAGANALDPFIYYDTDGKMYMAYGSFSNFGIYAVELDPQTGLRKDGLEGDDLLSGSTVSAAQRYGTQLVSNATEGPTISYHEDVALYSGDPTAYDKSNVTYEDRYYLMTSSGSLSDEIGQEGYNMRSYSSTTATGTYAAKNGGSRGSRVSGSFSWLTPEDIAAAGDDITLAYRGGVTYSWAVPGHNDMFTTSDGRNILVFHTRTFFDNTGECNSHFLTVTSYAFNSRGEIVMNPNRYAGERVRKVTAAEITGLGSNGNYVFNYVSSNNYEGSFNGGYASTGLNLTSDGKVTYNGSEVGTWTLYGDNWVYVNITGSIPAASGGQTLSGEFYGAAFPAYFEAEYRSGISISLISEDGLDCLYLNQTFGAYEE